MTISNKLDSLFVVAKDVGRIVRGKITVSQEEYKEIEALIHKEVLAELKPLVPKMSGEEYGWWVRGKIVDRIAELTEEKYGKSTS